MNDRKIFVQPDLDATYKEQGYVVIDLLESIAANRLLSAYKSDARDAGVPFYTTTWFPDVEYRRRNDQLIRDAVGSKLNFILHEYDNLYSSFIIKKRGIKKRVGLHADWQFVDEQHYSALNVWIALESIDAYSGSLQVIAGSHHKVNQLRGPNYQLDPDLTDLARFLKSVPLAKGQAILYDTKLLHASNPNIFKPQRVVASALMVPREAVAKYYFFDPKSPAEPQHSCDVSRTFYLEKCNFKRSYNGWEFVSPKGDELS